MYDYQLETLGLLNKLNQLKRNEYKNEKRIKQLEQENRELEADSRLLKALLSTNSELILRHSPDGEITFASPSSILILGYLPSELIGRNIYEFISSDDCLDYESFLQSLFKSNSERKIRLRIKHKFNDNIWFEAKTKVIDRSKGFIYREVLSWIYNISEDVQKEENLISLLKDLTLKSTIMSSLSDIQGKEILRMKIKEKDLKEVNSLRNKIIRIVAHDLKNPFGTLKNATELMIEQMETMTSEDVRKLCESINNSINRVNTFLDNLLNWSKTHSTKFDIKKSSLKLYNLVDENVQLYLPVLQNKDIKLHVNIKNDTRLFTEQNILGTVFRNILSNAIKYSETGGRIVINHYKKDKNDVLEIVDEGIGMDAELVSRINSCSNVSSSLGTKGERGTGLGLLIIQELLPKIGGRLFVESKLNQGSTFKVILPELL